MIQTILMILTVVGAGILIYAILDRGGFWFWISCTLQSSHSQYLSLWFTSEPVSCWRSIECERGDKLVLSIPSFRSDEEIRWDHIAQNRASDDVDALKLENPDITHSEESDIWRCLYTRHLQRVKKEEIEKSRRYNTCLNENGCSITRPGDLIKDGWWTKSMNLLF